MKATIEWIPGCVPPCEKRYLVTVEDYAGGLGTTAAWWSDEKKQWTDDEFTLAFLGLAVVAYAELPEPYSGETE